MIAICPESSRMTIASSKLQLKHPKKNDLNKLKAFKAFNQFKNINRKLTTKAIKILKKKAIINKNKTKVASRKISSGLLKSHQLT